MLKVIHVPCAKLVHNIYSNNCTIIKRQQRDKS